MEKPANEKIMSMFNLVTEFVQNKVNIKNTDDLHAMAYGLLLAYEALREELQERDKK